jgi:sugar lactone lactonase YvrE
MRPLRIAAASLSSLLIAAAAPHAIDLPGDRLFPESLSIAPDGTAYVGSMSGGVVRVSLKTGRAEQWIAPGAYGSGALFGVFADTRNGLLWTCTNDFSVRGITVPGADLGSFAKAFDLRTGQGKLSLPLPGGKPTCNDFAVAKDGTVFVTDTAASHILRWRPGTTALETWLSDPQLDGNGKPGGVDGIAFGSDGRLYVNNVRSGELFRIDIAADGTGKVTKLALSRPLVSPDGMRTLPGVGLVLAEGQGRVARVTVQGDRADIQTLAEGIVLPTGADAYKGIAWYVQGQLSYLFSQGKQGQPGLPFRLSPAMPAQ